MAVCCSNGCAQTSELSVIALFLLCSKSGLFRTTNPVHLTQRVTQEGAGHGQWAKAETEERKRKGPPAIVTGGASEAPQLGREAAGVDEGKRENGREPRSWYWQYRPRGLVELVVGRLRDMGP